MAGEDRKLEKLKEAYKTYFKHYSLQSALGLIWLTSALVGKFDIQISIFLLFFGLSMLKPMVYILSRFIRVKKIHKDETLVHMIKLTTIGILFGVMGVFFPFIENINYFFPAFAVIIGLIFGCISYTSRFFHYGAIAIMIMIGSLYLGYSFEDEFTYAGLFTGASLIGFGLLNWMAGEKTRVAFLRKKQSAKVWKESLVKQLESAMISENLNIKSAGSSVLDKQKV